MRIKSVNHRTISATITKGAEFKGQDENVARFTAVHHVGSEPLFLNCVMFANKGKKNERVIPMGKLSKGSVVVLDGFDKPTSYEKDGEKRRGQTDFVVTAVSEPELIDDNATEASEEEAEGDAANQE